jgi:superfamily II DNA or RNA helicase
MGNVGDLEHNIAASIQSISEHLDDFPATAFQYLVIDEAHHAAAKTYKQVLGYFRPQFVLGLTATPDRADGQSILEIFRDCAHRLSSAASWRRFAAFACSPTSMWAGCVSIKCSYNRKDIEETVIVPPRDRLIVDTYVKHVNGREAVAFCVNIRHGEALAELFRTSGVPARSVSGCMPGAEREKYLAAFHQGDLRVLCPAALCWHPPSSTPTPPGSHTEVA